MLHRILLNMTMEKGNEMYTPPMLLILETIREPPMLREEDDVFVIINLKNFISNVPIVDESIRADLTCFYLFDGQRWDSS